MKQLTWQHSVKPVLWNIRTGPICDKLRNQRIMVQVFGAAQNGLVAKLLGEVFFDNLSGGSWHISDVGFINVWRGIVDDIKAGRVLILNHRSSSSSLASGLKDMVKSMTQADIEALASVETTKKLAEAVCEPDDAEAICGRLDEYESRKERQSASEGPPGGPASAASYTLDAGLSLTSALGTLTDAEIDALARIAWDAADEPGEVSLGWDDILECDRDMYRRIVQAVVTAAARTLASS